MPLVSVDNHNCNKPNIITNTIEPCKDEIKLQNPKSETISPPNAIHKYDKKKITFYLSNINSASYAAKNYLFNKCCDHHIWSILETRCANSKQLQHFKQDLLNHNRTCCSNLAEPSPLGGPAHGGEVISVRNSLCTKVIDVHMVEYIAKQSSAPIRFSAVMIKVKGLTFIFANCYFYDSLGPTHTKNHNIFVQLEILITICKLPIFIHADFNCTPDQLADSGWPKRLKLEMLVPCESTLKNSEKIIQFVMLSPCLFPVCSSITIDHNTPWFPHYGLIVSFAAEPMAITANVQCKPQNLPMDDFQAQWKLLNDFQKIQKYSCAKRYATNKLNKQKQRTSVAILGKPTKELLLDPKFSEQFLFDSVAVGERFAQTALEAEYLVLLVCQLPSKEWKAYIGRSQYPKFAIKPVNKENKVISFYKDEDLTYWGSFKSFTTFTIQQIKYKGLHSTAAYGAILELQSRSEEADKYAERVGKDSQSLPIIFKEFTLMQRDDIDINIIRNILEQTTTIYTKLLAKCVLDRTNAFQQHVREQLAVGGGTLFKYISKLDKEYLNVDYKMRSDANFGNSPEPFLIAQCENFLKFWRPKVPEECTHQLYQNLKDVRQYAKEYPGDSTEHNPTNYKKKPYTIIKRTHQALIFGQTKH